MEREKTKTGPATDTSGDESNVGRLLKLMFKLKFTFTDSAIQEFAVSNLKGIFLEHCRNLDDAEAKNKTENGFRPHEIV